MKVFIKNMVCQRCVAAVQNVFQQNGFTPSSITLGEVLLQEENIPAKTLTEIDQQLLSLGFERIDDAKSRLIGKIKTLVIENVHYDKSGNAALKWSELITRDLPYDYKYLSQLFSSVEGITIEHYIIHQKIERAKELIIYDELTLSEIAYKLNYSSVPHFSSQFKKITGMTPSQFKNLNNPLRKALDEV